MKGKKIKDIYHSQHIISDEMLYPLQEWYNQLIDKTIEEVTVFDVARMIRQKEFLDIAITRAIAFLQEDPYTGDLYEGELMERLSGVETGQLAPYADEIKSIIARATEKSEEHTWLYPEERKEMEKIIRDLYSKIA